MPMDKQDYDLVRSLRDAVRDGDEVTARLLRRMIEANMEAQSQTAAAFNRIALALENLTEEVKGLRADLAPQLDKPKLSTPAQKKH